LLLNVNNLRILFNFSRRDAELAELLFGGYESSFRICLDSRKRKEAESGV